MSQLGKRYTCETCGTQILCTKAADPNPQCCGKEMEIQQPKKNAFIRLIQFADQT